MFETLDKNPHFNRWDGVPVLGYVTHNFRDRLRDRRDNVESRTYFGIDPHLEFAEYHLLTLSYISFTVTNALIAIELSK